MREAEKFNVKAGSKFARTYKRPARYGETIPVLIPGRKGKLRMVYAVKGERGWYPMANLARAWRVLQMEG